MTPKRPRDPNQASPTRSAEMVGLPISGEVHRLAALHCKGGYTAHLIAIREAAVILTPLHLAGVCMRHDQRHRAGWNQQLQLTSSGRRRLREDL